MTTALYLLRCKQAGFSVDELDYLDSGMVWDVITEKNNYTCDYPLKAGQEQFREFLGG